MPEQRNDKPQIPPPAAPREYRDRRRRLPTLVRYSIVALFGSLAALVAYFLLRTIGY